MDVKLKYEQLLVYSRGNNKCFYTKFEDGVNIIYGKNTSGKSTLIQLIHYSFGINDEKDKLSEILAEDIVTRLDCSLLKNGQKIKITFIREKDTLLIKNGDLPIESFNGIGNRSYEHSRLKKYISDLFCFTLYLEQKGVYKEASIETMFLPYYIAQDVGWTSIRQSFKGMSWYKNFKEDFLDYYLGIVNGENRLDKIEIEKELKEIQTKKEFYTTIEKTDTDLVISKITDEKFIEKSNEYINQYKNKKEELLKKEKKYVLKCNELSYYKERKSVLSKVKKSLEKQDPTRNTKCPICEQKLDYSIEFAYEYFQDVNDTDKELNIIKQKISNIQKDIDTLDKDIKELQKSINEEYEVLKKYTNQNITYETWIENKASLALSNQLNSNITKLAKEEDSIVEKLKFFKTNDDIKNERGRIDNKFQNIFSKYLKKLGLHNVFKEERFKKIYRISAFPTQGVELHKTILAYNFAFVSLIQNTNIHKFPFTLDAIFKEDIEDDNRDVIIDFISKNRNKDIQLLISIAEAEQQNNIDTYNKNYFDNQANLICIGGKRNERAFLTQCVNDDIKKLIFETKDLVDG